MTTTTIKLILAAIILADGHPVTTSKQQCSPRCFWTFPKNLRTRELIKTYELGEPVPVSQQQIWDAYHQLVTETKRLGAGRIGGFI